MTTETKAAFARRLGVAKSTVTRHAEAGRIVPTADGRIDVEASLARLAQTTGTRPDVSARHAAARGADSLGPAQAPQTAPAPRSAPAAGHAPPDDIETGSKARYKAMAMHFENADLKLGMALRRGIRHPLAAVKREAGAIGGTLRSALERLIDQTAPRLAVMHRPEDRAALIARETAAIRRLIRSEFPRALRRIRHTGDQS